MSDGPQAVATQIDDVCVWQLTEPAGTNPLVCLHPAPFDGTYFDAFAPRFARSRELLAPDYPGYGQSTAPLQPPDVADYAVAVANSVAQLRPDQPVHLLGFHTGCLIACELALTWPAVRQLILIDVPCFSAGEQQQKYADNFDVSDASTWGFGAAFRYACEERLAMVSQPALIIATDSSLHAATHRAATLIPRNVLEDCPDISRPVFSTGGDRIHALTEAFLQA